MSTSAAFRAQTVRDTEQGVMGDFISLKNRLVLLAREVYDINGKPRLDRRIFLTSHKGKKLFPDSNDSVSLNNFEAVIKLFKKEMASGFITEENYEEVSAQIIQLMRDHNITSISEFEGGYTAQTFIGHKDNGNIVVVRIPVKEPERQTRLNLPMIIQPEATLEIAGGMNVEILPYKPVIPNVGPAMREPIPGHSTMELGDFLIAGSDGYEQTYPNGPYDDFNTCVWTLRTLLKTVGFADSAIRDVAINPDGTFMFADPDTIKAGEKWKPEFAFQKLAVFFEDGFPPEGLFEWPETEYSAAERRAAFFASPYATRRL